MSSQMHVKTESHGFRKEHRISARQLSPAGRPTLLSDLTLEVHRGETLVLLGRSGSGKTTTMKLINRLIDPTEGQVKVDGKSTLNGIPFSSGVASAM